jgi:hypothetical protein
MRDEESHRGNRDPHDTVSEVASQASLRQKPTGYSGNILASRSARDNPVYYHAVDELRPKGQSVT